MAFSLVAIAATILVGTIVYKAPVRRLAGHIGALIKPAVIRVMRFKPGIEITNVSEKRESGLAVSHIVNLIGGERAALYVDGPWQLSAGEHCDQFSFRSIRTALHPIRTTYCYLVRVGDFVADDRETNVISGRRSVILSKNFKVHLVWDTEIFNIPRHNTDVGAQLPLFGILHDPQLIAGGLPLPTRPISSNRGGCQSSENHQSDSYFKYPFALTFFLINVMFMALGVWVAMFRSFRHIRWLPIDFSKLLLDGSLLPLLVKYYRFAENVSAVLRIEASATCYRSVEEGAHSLLADQHEVDDLERAPLVSSEIVPTKTLNR